MERLSSCYFCGAAVDRPIRAAPVVEGSPDSIDLPPADERATVTLCRPCREKLDRLLAAGLGIDAGRGSAPTETGETGDPTPRPDDGPDAAGRGLDPGADPTKDATGTAAAGDGDRRSDPGAGDASDAGSGGDLFGDADPVPVEDGADDGDDGDGDRDGDGVARSYKSSQAAGGRSDTYRLAAGRSDGRGGSDDRSGGGSDRTEAGADADHGDDGGDEADQNGESEEFDVPQEVHDRVVRLLQNREFPVDREDVLTVAVNAYDLPRADCEAAVDRLVARGVLDGGEDGSLYRPEE